MAADNTLLMGGINNVRVVHALVVPTIQVKTMIISNI